MAILTSYYSDVQYSMQVESEPMQQKIDQMLMGKEGIIGVKVDKHGNARVEYDNTAVGPRDILQMVEVFSLLFLYALNKVCII